MKGLYCIVIIIFCYLTTFSQQEKSEIKKSTEKVLISGKVYYIHIVLSGQTVYSISKVYNVSVGEIIAANPGINITEVKTGQSLKIPEISAPVIQESPVSDLSDNDFIYHQVKQKQTVYSLSKKYGIPIEVLYKFNPGTEAGLKIDQIIKIPKKKTYKEILKSTQTDENYYYYEVKKKDTLYSLALLYNVTVADIINANPELRWGLQTGKIIKIPRISFLSEDFIQKPDSMSDDTLNTFLNASECDTLKGFSRSKQIKIALILPFMADKLNKISIDDTLLFEENSDYNQTNDVKVIGKSYFEFYQGALTALDSLKKAGFNISVSVYDSELDTIKIKRIINNLYSNRPDLIIGPVYPDCIKLILGFSEKYGIPMVSPFYNRTEQLKQYSKVFQVIPSHETENDAIVDYLVKNADKNIILVHNGDTIANQDLYFFKKCFAKLTKQDSSLSHIVLNEIVNNDTSIATFRNIFSNDRKNIVVILSDNGIFVSSILSRIDLNSNRYNITVVGQPSWLSFQTVNIEYYHNLEVTIFTPFYIDYYDTQTKKFLKNFIHLYGKEPSGLNSNGFNSAYLGYDVTLYFVKALQKYGADFNKCLPYYNIHGILTDLSFFRVNEGKGFENKALNLVVFKKDDFSIFREIIKYKENVSGSNKEN